MRTASDVSSLQRLCEPASLLDDLIAITVFIILYLGPEAHRGLHLKLGPKAFGFPVPRPLGAILRSSTASSSGRFLVGYVNRT